MDPILTGILGGVIIAVLPICVVSPIETGGGGGWLLLVLLVLILWRRK